MTGFCSDENMSSIDPMFERSKIDISQKSNHMNLTLEVNTKDWILDA